MSDYSQEQEMGIEALQAIFMDDIKEIDPLDIGLHTSNRCFQILLSPQVEKVAENEWWAKIKQLKDGGHEELVERNFVRDGTDSCRYGSPARTLLMCLLVLSAFYVS